jgi:hypothetical protein
MPDLQVLRISQGRLAGRPDFEMIFDGAGEIADGPIFISGSDCAVQDVIRGLMTLISSSRLAPNFGTNYANLIGVRNVGQISGILSQEAQRILGYIVQVTAAEDPSERVIEIVDMKVKQEVDTVEIALTLRTATGQVVTVTVA